MAAPLVFACCCLLLPDRWMGACRAVRPANSSCLLHAAVARWHLGSSGMHNSSSTFDTGNLRLNGIAQLETATLGCTWYSSFTWDSSRAVNRRTAASHSRIGYNTYARRLRQYVLTAVLVIIQRVCCPLLVHARQDDTLSLGRFSRQRGQSANDLFVSIYSSYGCLLD